MAYDFSGYATKYNVKCTDGKTILNGAFDKDDKTRVPMLWHHLNSDPENVLGYADLEKRPDGVYARCSFNDSPKAQVAKHLVQHGDIYALSIHANGLTMVGSNVKEGRIRDVSLVTAGANKKALIDSISIAHADGTYTELDDEAIIWSEGFIDHEDNTSNETDSDSVSHADEAPTIESVYNSLNDEQKALMGMIVEAVKNGDIKQSDEGDDTIMKKNVFDNSTNDTGKKVVELKHEDVEAIFADAVKCGSLKQAFLEHADDLSEKYGIENIEILFPDAKALNNPPDLIKRDMEWVSSIVGGARHTPFSRIKSTQVDITADEARAKGYMKGHKKKEEVVVAMKRVTTPTTVYKKQKLDHDDVRDITDFDVVVFLKAEMRLMLNEELGRAALIGDGRAIDDEDKINEENIRPIWTDDELYTIHHTTTETEPRELIDEVVLAQEDYEGSGRPTMYIAPNLLTRMMLVKDENKRRIYGTEAELASAMRVSTIKEVPVMAGQIRTDGDGNRYELIAILVNPTDYTWGADKGGEIETFDDFDIDYNQHKYLMETRVSGALYRIKSAVVIERPVTSAAARSARTVSRSDSE